MDRNSFFTTPASAAAPSSGLLFFTFHKHASLFVTLCLFPVRVTLAWMDVRESLVPLDPR